MVTKGFSFGTPGARFEVWVRVLTRVLTAHIGGAPGGGVEVGVCVWVGLLPWVVVRFRVSGWDFGWGRRVGVRVRLRAGSADAGRIG